MLKIQQSYNYLSAFFSHIFKFILYIIIYFYRFVISPILPGRCRFLPTCSEYAIDAIKSKGVLKGSILALKRIAKCHPLGSSGFDPVDCCNKERKDTNSS